MDDTIVEWCDNNELLCNFINLLTESRVKRIAFIYLSWLYEKSNL